MKTAILIDSGCDVSHELIQRFHMKVMHLHIIYPERDYVGLYPCAGILYFQWIKRYI